MLAGSLPTLGGADGINDSVLDTEVDAQGRAVIIGASESASPLLTDTVTRSTTSGSFDASFDTHGKLTFTIARTPTAFSNDGVAKLDTFPDYLPAVIQPEGGGKLIAVVADGDGFRVLRRTGEVDCSFGDDLGCTSNGSFGGEATRDAMTMAGARPAIVSQRLGGGFMLVVVQAALSRLGLE